MARKTVDIKLNEIDKQIEELKRKRVEYIKKLNNEIGEYLVSKWDVQSIEEAKTLIDQFADQVDNLQSNTEQKSGNQSANNPSDIKSDVTP